MEVQGEQNGGRREEEDRPNPAEPRPGDPSGVGRSPAPGRGERDQVEKESEESFPASDAPSFTPGKLG